MATNHKLAECSAIREGSAASEAFRPQPLRRSVHEEIGSVFYRLVATGFLMTGFLMTGFLMTGFLMTGFLTNSSGSCWGQSPFIASEGTLIGQFFVQREQRFVFIDRNRESIPTVLQRWLSRAAAIKWFQQGVVLRQPCPFVRGVDDPANANAIRLDQEGESSEGWVHFMRACFVEELVVDRFAAEQRALVT